MTQPSTPPRGAGLGPDSGTTPTAPAKPQPAAPLTDEQLRLECVKQAISAGSDSRYVTEGASKLYEYIKTGTRNINAAPAFGHVG